MALRSKLLDEEVVKSAKEMLKKVRNNAYVSKKLNAVIAAKKYSITSVAKIYCISRYNAPICLDHFFQSDPIFKMNMLINTSTHI